MRDALRYSAIALMVSAGLVSLSPLQTNPFTIDRVNDAIAWASQPQFQSAGTSSDSDFELLVQEPSQRRALRPQSNTSMQRMNQRTSYHMLRAFGDAIGDSFKGTVELLVEKKRVALGAVVDRKGWIVTKASQIAKDAPVLCQFYNGTEARGEVVVRNDEYDLALIHVEDESLPVISWADSEIPHRGQWVATTDTHNTPAAVGVVSAGLQNIEKRRPYLGVVLDEADGDGALVKVVHTGTGADLAGLKAGDRISAIDGVPPANRSAALNTLSACSAGQCVTLAIVRGESKFETLAQLMDIPRELFDATEMEVNGLISARSAGFKNVFLHDTVLHPSQCGGPLVDLNGKVVGLNIARAGRVTSYALAASVARPVIDQMLAQGRSKVFDMPTGTSVTATASSSTSR